MSEGFCLRRAFHLVMSDERADSIAGDLVEMTAVRGRVWFWSQALRIWLRYAASKLCRKPLESAALAMSGLFVYTVTYAGIFQFMSFRQYAEYVIPGDRLASISMLPATAWLKLIPIVAGASLVTGLVMGRFGSRKSVHGIVPTLAVFGLYWLVWPVIGAFLFSLRWYLVVTGLFAFPFFALLPLAVGGAIGNSGRVR